MIDFTIEELVIPASIDDPDAAGFVEMTAVRNEIEAEIVGNRDLTLEPAELLPYYQDAHNPQTCLVARVSGKIVARAIIEVPSEEDSRDLWLSVEVLSDFRRNGIGSALYDGLLELARATGRKILQSYPMHKHSPDSAQLPSPTGFGSIPIENPESRFLLARGFKLEQVERYSRLQLPMLQEKFDSLYSAAEAAAGSDYRVVRWIGRTPEKYLTSMAKLHNRMSTDAPTAALDFAEEDWDEKRVIELDDSRQKSPRIMLTVAAEDVFSGDLVGFSELLVPPQISRAVDQNDTLILKEHRGHRLGMLLKLSNLQYLEETFPGHPAVTTFNAEENRPMLEVNEAMGFVPVGYAGGWKRDTA
ncbi:MAG: GNAT family N-acetyltransferase [Homoserinimonas sp.]|nr:GNAT family N-acetyltransferase [Homoserinimonas sp.]MCW5944468.1 GNAT family N-acetyltransferase [Cryobacterium sp.]